MNADTHDTSGSVPAGEEALISARTLAIWLGVSENTIRKWLARGPDAGVLPRTLRINGQVRFKPADVRDWLDAMTVR